MQYNQEELLAKANKPLEIASALHSFYKGKIAITPKCRVRDLHDFDVWYTPGVSAACKDIVKDPAATIHTDPNITGQQPLRKVCRGKLNPLVAVKNIRLPVAQRFLETFHAKRCVQRITEPPG